MYIVLGPTSRDFAYYCVRDVVLGVASSCRLADLQQSQFSSKKAAAWNFSSQAADFLTLAHCDTLSSLTRCLQRRDPAGGSGRTELEAAVGRVEPLLLRLL